MPSAAIVNYHHWLPLTQAFWPGTLSSSDGQRFPTKGKSITAGRCRGISPGVRAYRSTPTSPTSIPPSTRR
ncbi:Tn3 family transposase [Streptomyces coeruleorubidus]